MKDLSHAATLNSTYVPKHNMRLVAKLSVEGKKLVAIHQHLRLGVPELTLLG